MFDKVKDFFGFGGNDEPRAAEDAVELDVEEPVVKERKPGRSDESGKNGLCVVELGDIGLVKSPVKPYAKGYYKPDNEKCNKFVYVHVIITFVLS